MTYPANNTYPAINTYPAGGTTTPVDPGTPTPGGLTCDQVRAEIEAMERQFQKKMRSKVTIDVYDGNWSEDSHQHVVGEIEGDCEEILNDTGESTIKMFAEHKLADWIDDELDDDEDVHIIITIEGVRWSGLAADIIEQGTEDGKEYFTLQCISEYEHMKRVVCYCNPFFAAEFQYPKLYAYAGPSVTGVKTLLFLNLLRRFAPLWALPENLFDPSSWQDNLNPNNWPIVVMPGNVLTDTSMWTVLSTRMGMFHDVVAPTLSDAKLRIKLTRWMPGDVQPAPSHFTLTKPTLLVDVIDQSGYVGPSGTLLDGLLHFGSSVAADLINEVNTAFNYNADEPEYQIPGFLGTVSEPRCVFRKAHRTGATGISSWERHRIKSNASIVITGGHSPDWVNTGLKLLVNGILGYIGAMFGNPGLTLGIFDSQIEDVVLAFHRVGNPIKQAKMGLRGPPLGEVFESSGGTGFSLTALQAIRVGMWRSRPMQTFKFTVRNGAPYWIGLDIDLGDRGLFEHGRRRKLHSERVHSRKAAWGRDRDAKWTMSIGDDKPIDQPGAVLARSVEQVRGIIQSVGVSS
ncbi:hypothetical protein GCM10007304_17530 [Rhodococcoides trifolii]|uniref:Gp28/Gp37-like domain-containing protein n=1 Tax=Rhodococcoides trifolii TaxID=908250 RepID=A0A917FVA0_9NOCA|nr:hypothetical protein [Rhodococcus trifolii]GGG03878.1 hypothetical protein GCM10007304_17530 [Rhodococcus trifolii]